MASVNPNDTIVSWSVLSSVMFPGAARSASSVSWSSYESSASGDPTSLGSPGNAGVSAVTGKSNEGPGAGPGDAKALSASAAPSFEEADSARRLDERVCCRNQTPPRDPPHRRETTNPHLCEEHAILTNLQAHQACDVTIEKCVRADGEADGEIRDDIDMTTSPSEFRETQQSAATPQTGSDSQIDYWGFGFIGGPHEICSRDLALGLGFGFRVRVRVRTPCSSFSIVSRS